MRYEIKKLKPTSAGTRHVVRIKTHGLHKGAPHKSLVVKSSKKKFGAHAGRNNQGRITTRHRGGGHAKSLRLIDFKRRMDAVPAKIVRFEYDPFRTAHIALVLYDNGVYAYHLAVEGQKVGDKVMSGESASIDKGNCLPLMNIPVGTTICCIEMKAGKGAQLLRSAGTSGMLVGKEHGYAIVRLQSGEMRKIHLGCRAMIGVVSNQMHNLRKLGKAGAKRHLGVRPTVRGVAMNPVDHPMGGGEGRSSGGRHPVSPTGVLAKGLRTRVNKRSNAFIVRRRKSRK